MFSKLVNYNFPKELAWLIGGKTLQVPLNATP